MASGPPAPLGSVRRTRTLVALLWPLLVTCCRVASAQELPTNGVNGYSLHPPYFNLAEGTKITATATCGEEETGRTVHDLYCKLVGGPVSGDPSQTIQVSGTRCAALVCVVLRLLIRLLDSARRSACFEATLNHEES